MTPRVTLRAYLEGRRAGVVGPRLVTLSGTGGVGKTRMALELAAEVREAYPDGVWLVELDLLAEPTLVPLAVATPLGVRSESQIPPLEVLIDFLRPRRLLLVLDNCEHRFRMLVGRSHTAAQRHQTLRASIDWSYELLSVEERDVLCRVSVFTGGWTLEAAEAVCAGDDLESDDILEYLSALVDKSLVVAERGQDGQARYRLPHRARIEQPRDRRDTCRRPANGEQSRGTHIRQVGLPLP